MRKKVISLQELEERVLENEMRTKERESASLCKRQMKYTTMDNYFKITIIKKSMIIL